MLKIRSNCKSSDGSSPSASPACHWRQLIVHSQWPTPRHALLFPLPPTNRLQTHRKAFWPVGSVPAVGYFSSKLYGSCPASWSVSPFWSGRTDSAHQKALEMETSPYRYLWRGCALGACIPKAPSGPQHGLHRNIGARNSSLRLS